MRKLIFLALIIGGGWHWYKNYSGNEVVLDEAGNPVVVIYTAKQCGAPCQDALNLLDSRRVPYQHTEVDFDDRESEDFKHWRSISNDAVPFTMAGHSKVRGSSKWELIGLLGKNFGDTYLTVDEVGYFSRHFDANGAPMVALYGTAWCGYCAALRKDLQENGVDFVDIDVEKSGEFDKVTRVMDIPGYPAVWVGYHRVHGTNYSAVKAAMN